MKLSQILKQLRNQRINQNKCRFMDADEFAEILENSGKSGKTKGQVNR